MAFVELPPLVKRLRVVVVTGYDQHDPNWLATTQGEILRTTNEEPLNQPFNQNGNIQQFLAYKAVNKAGKVGFIHVSSIQPWDGDDDMRVVHILTLIVLILTGFEVFSGSILYG